jgi:hypothetical protein
MHHRPHRLSPALGDQGPAVSRLLSLVAFAMIIDWIGRSKEGKAKQDNSCIMLDTLINYVLSISG